MSSDNKGVKESKDSKDDEAPKPVTSLDAADIELLKTYVCSLAIDQVLSIAEIANHKSVQCRASAHTHCQ